MINKIKDRSSALWRKIPRPFRKLLWSQLRKVGISTPLRAPPRKVDGAQIKNGPIIVSGFFNDTRGVAKIAKLAVDALRQARHEVIEHDISYLLRGDEPPLFNVPANAGSWILYCNPPEAKVVMHQHLNLGNAPLYRIGAWSWELSSAPSEWIEFSDSFHEIWALTEFQARAFTAARVPVRVMSPPVRCRPTTFRFNPKCFTVLHVSDFRSSAARKNPAAALAAYLGAFSEADGCQLLMKLSACEQDRPAYDALKAMVKARRDIHFLDEQLQASDMDELYAQSDVIISLHRAEGFGLPVAEAMAVGKAVVTTGWSGVLDFVPSLDGAQLAPYRLVSVHDQSGLYRGGFWAEPDIEAAKRMLRRFKEDGQLRMQASKENRAAIGKLARTWSGEDALPHLTRLAKRALADVG